MRARQDTSPEPSRHASRTKACRQPTHTKHEAKWLRAHPGLLPPLHVRRPPFLLPAVTALFSPESKMMTVSAVARLMPRPPARVDSRKAKSAEPAGRHRGGAQQGPAQLRS